MFKLLFTLSLITCFSIVSFSQKKFQQKKSRKDYFGGPIDYRNLSNMGLQISFGPNYTVTHKALPAQVVDGGAGRYNFKQQAGGRLGGFAEIGMVHYRMKPSKFPGLNGKNLIHLLDWGIGFDYIGGREKTTINYLDSVGGTASTSTGKGAFYHGFVYGRVTFQRNKKISGDGSKHLNYGVGLNGHYAVMGRNQSYTGAVETSNQVFQDPLMIQFHATLGITVRLNRGDYLVPGVWAPLAGLYKAKEGKPSIHWYSNTYWPIHFQLKWLHSFTKKSSGCNTGSDADRKKNEEYMQNR